MPNTNATNNPYHNKLVYQIEQKAKLNNQLRQLGNPYNGSVEMQKTHIQQTLGSMKK